MVQSLKSPGKALKTHVGCTHDVSAPANVLTRARLMMQDNPEDNWLHFDLLISIFEYLLIIAGSLMLIFMF